MLDFFVATSLHKNNSLLLCKTPQLSAQICSCCFEHKHWNDIIHYDITWCFSFWCLLVQRNDICNVFSYLSFACASLQMSDLDYRSAFVCSVNKTIKTWEDYTEYISVFFTFFLHKTNLIQSYLLLKFSKSAVLITKSVIKMCSACRYMHGLTEACCSLVTILNS